MLRPFASLLVVIAGTVTSAACSPSGPPRAVPLDRVSERVAPVTDDVFRHVVVVYPRSARSGSAPTVFLDDRGAYLGAVGPGQASLIALPATATTLYAVSSVELWAPPGSWFTVEVVRADAVTGGLLLRSRGGRSRSGGGGQHASIVIATDADFRDAAGNVEITWVATRIEDGQRWLGEHRARVDEILARRDEDPTSTVTTRVVVP